jgi:hypothetical protein
VRPSGGGPHRGGGDVRPSGGIAVVTMSAKNFHAWPRYRFNKAQQGKDHREQTRNPQSIQGGCFSWEKPR